MNEIQSGIKNEIKKSELQSEIQYGIAWNDNFLIGDAEVDSQHFRIFELLSGLIGSCIEGSHAENIHETLDFLVNYTVHHFYDEESLQVQSNYPDYRKHKQQHEDFKSTVGEIVRKFEEEGSSLELSNDLSKIVARWLVNHITREDKKIGEHLRTLH